MQTVKYQTCTDLDLNYILLRFYERVAWFGKYDWRRQTKNLTRMELSQFPKNGNNVASNGIIFNWLGGWDFTTVNVDIIRLICSEAASI